MLICIDFQGTHGFQNVTVNSSSRGVINVTGNFIPGSAANAILVIIYSETLRDVYYMFSSQSVQEKIMASVGGLPCGLYNVSIFVVEDSGPRVPQHQGMC